ncbi:type II toxin-antitoxin system Phd/YefM family antitoxin [Plantactinospora sp. WMMB782]|uniref:type II toxin-antitoxin system Phd/YefM family antitoxin n=1 Tax=Plantactinospora sp. WMMB782 TaxID=3404121 RepID=UPI003B93E97A
MTKKERHPTEERSVRDAREHFADVLYAAAAGRVTYITSRGRRIAAVVPLAVADDAVENSE